MRSFWALLTGVAAALAAGLYFFSGSEAKAATGEGDGSEIWDPESNLTPPSEAPSEAYGDASFLYWLPGTSGGEKLSKSTADKIDPRVKALEPTIRAAAARFYVPTDLLAAVLHRESRGDLTAVGDGGESLGAGQVQAETAKTINRYWGTNLRRDNWVHNIYLASANLSRLYQELNTSWWPGTTRPLGRQWYDAVRGYLCGKRGAEQDPSCAAQEARERLAIAGMESQIPDA
jgi:hypothetical protein